MTIKDAVNFYASQLNNTDSPIREARLLVGLVTGMRMTELIVNERYMINPVVLERLEKYVKRRAKGEPFAYIAGEKEFRGLSFYVDKNVLIPRPDTEMLVNFAEGKESSVLDLCTGSGCIAISLAKAMPWAKVTAVDVSKEALEVAKRNAERHGVDVEFVRKDILKNRIAFDRKFMVAVCNPPYISPRVIETLEPDVRDYEPRIALDGGEDGLVFYRKIVRDAELFLEEGGRLCLEIGYDQAQAVKEILSEKFDDIQVIKDYAGEERVVTATMRQYKKHSHDGHRSRLRDRFRKEGLDGFQPHEILELVLCYAIPRRNINEIAHGLIDRFGSVSAVFDADEEELVSKGGITGNAAVLLRMMPELSRVYRIDRWKDKVNLSKTSAAGQYAVDLFVGSSYEEFYVLSLDNSGGLLNCEKISTGTINETPIYPRLVVEAALACKANKVIVTHNHPSGSTIPSWMDIQSTKKIKAALENIDITFVDHIIVGGENYSSMKERGDI